MLINGRPDSLISGSDRGLQYGDGLFETLAVSQGRPCLWNRHMNRLLRGCGVLGIPSPDQEQLLREVTRLIGSASCGVIKIILTRGPGGRGYRPPDEVIPTRIVQFANWPDYPPDARERGVKARVCDTRLGVSPALAGLKTLNRLEQVLARAEWDDPGIREGLMLDIEDRVIEGTMSNLFLLREGEIKTPELTRCGIAGVMRELIIERAAALDIPTSVERLTLQDLKAADALFLSNSLIGIWPIRELAGRRFDPRAIPDTLVDAVMLHGFRFG